MSNCSIKCLVEAFRLSNLFTIIFRGSWWRYFLMFIFVFDYSSMVVNSQGSNTKYINSNNYELVPPTTNRGSYENPPYPTPSYFNQYDNNGNTNSKFDLPDPKQTNRGNLYKPESERNGYSQNGYSSKSSKWSTSDDTKFNKNMEPNVNLNQLLKKIKQNEKKMKSTYTREFGTYIGRFRPRAHGISGSVYAVDERHLFIRNFRYDGGGTYVPQAYFWVGSGSQPDNKGQIVPYPALGEDTIENLGVNKYGRQSGRRRQGNTRGNARKGTYGHPGNRNLVPGDLKGRSKTNLKNEQQDYPPLKKMENEEVLLTLPDQLKIANIRWLCVWGARFTQNFGDIMIRQDIQVPQAKKLEEFQSSDPYQLDVDGRITILDSESFYLPNLKMNIIENGYNFWVGNYSSISMGNKLVPDGKMTKIPNEMSHFTDLHVYNGEDIILTLPISNGRQLSVYDINFISVYKEETQNMLGFITFDTNNDRIPPALGQTKKPGWWFVATTPRPPSTISPPNPSDPTFFNQTLELPNCKELLGRKIRLLWQQESGNHVYFRLRVYNMKLDQFAAIGIAAPRRADIEADYVKVFWNDSTQTFQTQDSYASSKRQGKRSCTLQEGLCPDKDQSGVSLDQVEFRGGMKNTYTNTFDVDFRRSILPMDKFDSPIPFSGNAQVIVAIGSIRRPVTDGGYQPYRPNFRLENETVTIDFSSNDNKCPNSPAPDPIKEEVWEKSTIQDETHFEAILGPTGGRKGYEEITGGDVTDKSAVWWINARLMPEIYVQRGKTYFFKVQGGDGRINTLDHPLYITDNKEGGYDIKTQYEKQLETIYAGVESEFGMVGIPFQGNEGENLGLNGNSRLNKYQTGLNSQRDPSISGINRLENNGIIGGTGYRPYLKGGSKFQATGAGPCCIYEAKDGADKASESKTFEDYFATLQKSCEANREYQYGWVNWTVAAETPDVVYYQSFKAYGLGWKIMVLDEGEEPSQANPNVNSLYTQYIISLSITVLIRAFIISIL